MMPHRLHFHGGGFLLPIILITAAVVVLVIVLKYVFRKDLQKSYVQDFSQSGDIIPAEAEALAALQENGAPMLQTELAGLLDADPTALASVVHDLEQRGLITRQWSPDENTYVVAVARGEEK
jgi:DNA-binding MarR family transcriptional regulator